MDAGATIGYSITVMARRRHIRAAVALTAAYAFALQAMLGFALLSSQSLAGSPLAVICFNGSDAPGSSPAHEAPITCAAACAAACTVISTGAPGAPVLDGPTAVRSHALKLFSRMAQVPVRIDRTQSPRAPPLA